MLASINTVGNGVILYSSGTALIRYLYLRSSFEDNIQKVLKRDHFVMKSILIGESFNFLTFGSFYFQMGSSEFGRSPLVLYQACMDPWKDHTFPVYKLMPWNQLFMVFLIASNVSCNLFLYRYLERRTENNIARSEADKMKDRKRNLVPARIGMMNIFLYVVAMAFFMFAYSFKSDSLDSGTRAFMIAAFGDFMHCIFSPIFIISGSMDARRKVREIFTKPVLM